MEQGQDVSRSLNFFQITDKIYSLESTRPLQRSLKSPTRPHRLDMETKDAAVFNKYSMREPYLIAKEATAPGNRQRLLKVLCMDRRAFYYHKQRRIFKRHNYEFKVTADGAQKGVKSMSPLPKLKRSTPSPVRAFTPNFVPELTQKVDVTRRSKQRMDYNASLKTLIAKCRSVKGRNRLKDRTDKEQALMRSRSKHLEWTKEVLDQVIGCEPAVLMPYYESQRDAFESFREDVYRFAEEHNRAARDPSKEAARFAQMLRNNKNMVI